MVKAKTEKWKLLINAFQKQVTQMEEVDQSKDQLQSLVEFWEGVKVNNPVAQLNAIIAAANPPADPKAPKDVQPVATDSDNKNKQYLEFVCKCIRRAMELPETDFNELNETLTNKVKVDVACEEGVLGLLESRIKNLTDDIVAK